MGVVEHLKGPSSDLVTYSENSRFNPNYINRYCPNVVLYLPLAVSST